MKIRKTLLLILCIGLIFFTQCEKDTTSSPERNTLEESFSAEIEATSKVLSSLLEDEGFSLLEEDIEEENKGTGPSRERLQRAHILFPRVNFLRHFLSHSPFLIEDTVDERSITVEDLAGLYHFRRPDTIQHARFFESIEEKTDSIILLLPHRNMRRLKHRFFHSDVDTIGDNMLDFKIISTKYSRPYLRSKEISYNATLQRKDSVTDIFNTMLKVDIDIDPVAYTFKRSLILRNGSQLEEIFDSTKYTQLFLSPEGDTLLMNRNVLEDDTIRIYLTTGNLDIHFLGNKNIKLFIDGILQDVEIAYLEGTKRLQFTFSDGTVRVLHDLTNGVFEKVGDILVRSRKMFFVRHHLDKLAFEQTKNE